MDGQPVGQANRLCARYKKRYRKLVILDGGFHWEKNAAATTNKLFEIVFLRADIETHCHSIPQQNYFLDPSDPTVPAKEKRMMVLGWCIAATEACVHETNKSILEINEVDVIDHLKKATLDNALAGAVFLDMILSQIYFNMIDCETRVQPEEVGTNNYHVHFFMFSSGFTWNTNYTMPCVFRLQCYIGNDIIVYFILALELPTIYTLCNKYEDNNTLYNTVNHTTNIYIYIHLHITYTQK